MSVNQPQVQKQKIIWSTIRNKLNISLHQENLLAILRLQEIQTNLQKFLSFYTEGNRNEDLPDNLKFLSKYDITRSMKDFIFDIASCLNMTKMRCFELLDSYFSLHIEELRKISDLLILSYTFEDKSSQRYLNILKDLEYKKSKIIEFYFEERKNLILFFLDIFFQIFLETENKRLFDFMDNFIKSKKMLEVFYNQLINYGNIGQIFDSTKLNNRYVHEIKNMIPLYLCEEQNLILELIMILVHQGKYTEPKIFEGLLQYFIKTEFYCQSPLLVFENNNLKDEIMIKCLLITLSGFQPDVINKLINGENNLVQDIICFKNDFNFDTILSVFRQPLNNHVLIPIKLTIEVIVSILKKYRGQINNSQQKITNYENINNKQIQDKECFGFLNLIEQKIQLFEGEYNIEKGLTIYDIYYDILYDWINMLMQIYYEQNIDLYEPLLYQLLFRIMSHLLPQRKFYTNLLIGQKNTNITQFFNNIKQDFTKRDIFLNFCFSLSKPIEPGENDEEGLLNILLIEPIEKLKKDLEDEDEMDMNRKKEIIEENEKDIFFYDLFDEWNDLIQLLFTYSQNQFQKSNMEILPEDLSNQIKYIRLFIRAVLPSNNFNDFIFNFTYYYNMKERNNMSENNIEEEDMNYGVQEYNPNIFKKLIFSSVTVLSLITEMQIYNKNILFGEFITELLKLFILYTKDNHFVKCLQGMNYFFEKFNGKSIIFNIIENDNNTQDFSNTLYAVKFIKEMFKPEIFLQVARNEEFNTPNKLGEIFYVSNFYYIKELINHFTQINEYLSPTNALIISELNETMIQIMNYLEIKNNFYKIDVTEVQKDIYDNKNLINFVIKLLMQDNRDYVIDNDYKQMGNNNILLIDFIFKYLGVKINDDIVRNFNINKINDVKKKLFYNNAYIQQYLAKNRIQKENYNINSSYNIGCYKKMILSSLNCLSLLLSLIIIHNKQEKENKEKKNNLSKYTNINFINRLNYNLLIAKEIPNYIYESIDEKRKYHLNIILLLFFYSLYEIDKNEQLIIERNSIKNLDEEQPTEFEFFVVGLKSDSHLNICTAALNNICKILYIIKDTGISLNNHFILEKNSSSEINTNINLFKLLRFKMITILGSKNHDIDLLKIEILKLLIISTKYQFSFVRNFIQGNDDIFFSEIVFTNLNNSLKFDNNNFNNLELDNSQSDFDLKIQSKSLNGELYTYVLMFISELLNNTQDMKILENLLIKERGKEFITCLINYGIHSCDISKNCDEFNKILYQYLRAQNINISDMLNLSNSLKLLIDIFSIKLNIIEYLSILFKRVLLFSKETKKIKFNFEYTKELKYFIQNHIRCLVEFFAKISEFNNLQNMIKNISKELFIKGIQIKENYLSDNEIINKDNLEMVIQDYLFNYDFNYSFDIKEIITKGFYDNLFRDKYLKNIILYNCFICYYYIFAQSYSQSAHLFGLIFSIGESNYLLTDKLFTNVEIYKIFKDNENNKNIIDSYNDEINSILSLDNCYNYKLTFNPLKDLFENNIDSAIKFIRDNIISRSINIESIPNLSSNENRLYYQMLNCSLDYILYLHNKSVCSKNTISTKIAFSEFLKKVIAIINMGLSNNNISDNNLLSVFNLIYHIVYYLVLTENGLDNDENEINNDIIINDNNNEKIQVILDLMDILILIFKKIKECRSIILYIFSCIVYIKNDLIKKSLRDLFDIILKLYSKENDSFEFHSFLLLINRMRINYPYLLLEIMKDSQIFNFIYMKCSYNCYMNLYTKKIHNSEHLIYIWTLKILSNILNTYLTKIDNELKPNYNNAVSNIIKFLELIQQRFKDLFNLCSENNNFISGLTQNNYISLAYLEELKASMELITGFISIECDNSCPLTKDQSFLEFLFDSIDMIANTCLYLYKNGYKNINTICKANSKVETLMINTKIKNSDLSEDDNFNRINLLNNNINNANDFYSNQFQNINEENIYKNMIMFNNNQKRNDERKNNLIYNNEIDIEQLYINDKSANVFHFKVKTNLMIILFNISSCMIQLLNRQNFNLKKYLFNKYQLKEFETQLKTWPMLYLSSVKFASDFLKDIMNNLKMYKILYNKNIILLNSINISLGNCFISEIYPEYPLNELIDLILFILSDFCEINPNFNDFIELILKNHPYINNSRAILTEMYQLCKIINIQINKYSKEFDEDDNFLGEFEDLKKNVEMSVKNVRLNKI